MGDMVLEVHIVVLRVAVVGSAVVRGAVIMVGLEKMRGSAVRRTWSCDW